MHGLYREWFCAWITKGLRLDGAAIPKISKRHFFQDIWFSCQWVTGMGLKPRQNFFCKNISKTVDARHCQNFGLLKGVAAVEVVSWSKFFAQFIQGMWLTTGENFKQISQRVNELWLSLFKFTAPQWPVSVILACSGTKNYGNRP